MIQFPGSFHFISFLVSTTEKYSLQRASALSAKFVAKTTCTSRKKGSGLEFPSPHSPFLLISLAAPTTQAKSVKSHELGNNRQVRCNKLCCFVRIASNRQSSQQVTHLHLACIAWRFCREHDWAAKPQKRAQTSQSAPISSRFLCPRPPLLGTLSKDDDDVSENVGKNDFAFFQS